MIIRIKYIIQYDNDIHSSVLTAFIEMETEGGSLDLVTVASLGQSDKTGNDSKLEFHRKIPGLNCSAAARLIAIPTPSINAKISPPMVMEYPIKNSVDISIQYNLTENV